MSNACEIVVVKEPQLIVEFQTCNNPSITELKTESLVIEFPEKIQIINTAPPPALPNPEAETIIDSYEAASTININRVIVLRTDGRIEHADIATTLDEWDIIGISKQSGVAGEMIDVVKFGRLSGATIGSIGDSFMLGTDGQLVTTAPLSGFWLHVATQIRANEIFVKIGEPIQT